MSSQLKRTLDRVPTAVRALPNAAVSQLSRTELPQTDDPVDRLLARYAVELFGSTLGSQRRTRVAAHS